MTQSLRCFMTGATGAIGRPAVRALIDAGHEVRGVARTPERAASLEAAGAEAVAVDIFDHDAVVASVAGSDAILHLATNVPPLAKMALKPAWRTHNRLRTEATRHLIDAVRIHGIRRFVKESITFTYPDRGAEWIDESVPPEEGVKMLAPTLEGERLVLALSGTVGDGVVLRFGLFYGPDARATDEALRLARVRAAPTTGHPDAYVSSIHVDDAASAVVAALGAPAGVYNVVDDEPLTRREYADAFAAAFDLPHLRIAPAGMMRAVGGSSARALTASQRVSNRRFREATGWAPAYRSAREGWAAIGAARGHDRNDRSDDQSADDQGASR
jgi:nucleoside-diphosphate-sugar epimerase